MVQSSPSGWIKPARRNNFDIRTARHHIINWDVPRAVLEDSLSVCSPRSIHSPSVYAYGTGFQITIRIGMAHGDKPRDIGIYFSNCSYMCRGVKVAPTQNVVPIEFSLRHHPPGTSHPCIILDARVMMDSDWGRARVFNAVSISDVQPHLVDGVLRLSAAFKILN
jgi:hypothetical protein